MIDGAGAAAKKITKNVTRPFRQLAKKASRPLKNYRALRVFKAYDLTLPESAPQRQTQDVADKQRRTIHAVYFCYSTDPRACHAFTFTKMHPTR
jgi:hypothetical protein